MFPDLYLCSDLSSAFGYPGFSSYTCDEMEPNSQDGYGRTMSKEGDDIGLYLLIVQWGSVIED
jgi:hypothetical protein